MGQTVIPAQLLSSLLVYSLQNRKKKEIIHSTLPISYLGIVDVLVTSGAGFTASIGFISRFSVWLIHRSGGFSSLFFFFAEPLA